MYNDNQPDGGLNDPEFETPVEIDEILQSSQELREYAIEQFIGLIRNAVIKIGQVATNGTNSFRAETMKDPFGDSLMCFMALAVDLKSLERIGVSEEDFLNEISSHVSSISEYFSDLRSMDE